MKFSMKPTAKKLILGLLLAREGQPLSAQQAIAACALFNITANNVRVALVRLSSESMIEAAERGSYRLGIAAQGLAAEVVRWHDAEQQLAPWRGGYVAVHCAALGRADRKALRRRERALSLLGLRELDKGLYLRPDNLAGGVAAVRDRLQALGLEPEAAVFAAAEFDEARSPRISQLWDGAALTKTYLEQRQRLEDWLSRCAGLELDVAARESYLLGGQAIRQLVFDPWLPSPLVDADARHAFFTTVQRFDETGKAIWSGLFQSSLAMPSAAAASHLSSGVLQ